MGAECCGGARHRVRERDEIERDRFDSDDREKKSRKLGSARSSKRSSSSRQRNVARKKQRSAPTKQKYQKSSENKYSPSVTKYSPSVTKSKYSSQMKSEKTSKRTSKRRSKKLRTSSKGSPVTLEKCNSCNRNVDPLHGSGKKIQIKQFGQFGKKFSATLCFCHDCVPDCEKCSNELQSTGGLVEDIQDLRTFFCSETCYKYAHKSKNTVKGVTTSEIAGSSIKEMEETTFENDFDEMMRKIAPLLASTLRSPTCYFCRCPFLPKDRMSESLSRKAHFDCAAAGKAVYNKTRKKPKDPPMQPRVIAGYMIHQIELDMKKCKQVTPDKDPMRYAEKNHCIKFEVSCGGKKKCLYFVFVDLKHARDAVDSIDGSDPVTFLFHSVDSKTQKLKKGMDFQSDILNDFVVKNIASGGLQFVQDMEKTALTASNEKSVTFQTDMMRSNAGVSIRFRLNFSYFPKSGKLKILQSEMLHTKI